MQVNPSPYRQIFWTAVIAAVLVLLPAIAGQIDSDNGISNAADLDFWDGLIGVAIAAALRAIVAFIPVTTGTRRDDRVV